MQQDNKVIALYADHEKADAAVRALQRAGFDMTHLSVVGRDFETEEQVLGYVSTGDRVRYWGRFGTFWGALWGVLLGSAMLLFPGVGHVIVLGPLASALLNLAGGAALGGGLGALSGALGSIGVPPDRIVKYTEAIGSGHYALIVHGSEEEVREAKRLLESAGPESVDEHGAMLQPA